MDALIERGILEAEPGPCGSQRLLREDGDMAVARADIPPGEAVSVEVIRLCERRVKHRSRFCDAFGDLGDTVERIGQMLQRLETGHQIKLPLRARSVRRHHRIVGYSLSKTVGAQRRAKHV